MRFDFSKTMQHEEEEEEEEKDKDEEKRTKQRTEIRTDDRFGTGLRVEYEDELLVTKLCVAFAIAICSLPMIYLFLF